MYQSNFTLDSIIADYNCRMIAIFAGSLKFYIKQLSISA